MARASVAAQRRRARSSSTDSRLVYFVLMVWTVTFRMQTILPIEGENWISYSGETPKCDRAPSIDPSVIRGAPSMLSIGMVTAKGGRYYTDLAARTDYYVSGGESPGVWHENDA